MEYLSRVRVILDKRLNFTWSASHTRPVKLLETLWHWAPEKGFAGGKWINLTN